MVCVRQAKARLKDKFKATRREFREFRRKLRKARFKANTFPKVLKLFKPKIEQAIANLDMGNSANKDGIAAASGAPRMALAALMDFLRTKIEAKISKGLTKMFDAVTKLLWKVIDPIVSALKSSLIAAVGSIPFVGGALAAVISVVFDQIYAVVKTGVGKAITKLKELISTQVVKTILDAVFSAFPRNSDPEIEECASCCSSSATLDAGQHFQQLGQSEQNSDWFLKSLGDNSALEANAAAASKSVVGPMQDAIARQAAESEKAAANTEGELLKDAAEQGAEEQAEQQTEDDEETDLDGEDEESDADDEDVEEEEEEMEREEALSRFMRKHSLSQESYESQSFDN